LSAQPSGVTPPPSCSAGSNTVQLLLRMPDGKLLQLSALPVEHVTPSGTNNLLQPSQVCCYSHETEVYEIFVILHHVLYIVMKFVTFF